MLGILASLAIAGAGAAAILSMIVTIRAHSGAVRRLLAEARSMESNRVFVVQMTDDIAGAEAFSFARLRRAHQRPPYRVMERAVAAKSARAAA